jgi:ABC-2 type transport system ATP-binding protein
VTSAGATQDLAIDASGLTRRFGDFVAVNDLTLRVQRGEVYGLLGPNGSGKTTTMRMLCGVLPPSGGAARVLGVDVTREPDAVKRRIGYMAQRAGLYEDLTVREHLEFYAQLYGLGGTARREVVARAMAGLGLEARAGTLAGHLPGGLRQRLAFGCAAVHRPALLFLDEPTAGMDPAARRAFWQDLRELSLDGTSVLVTTHLMPEAEHCDHLAIMHRGSVVAAGAPGALRGSLRNPLLGVDTDAPHATLDVLEPLPWVAEVALFGTLVHVLVAPDVTLEAAQQGVLGALREASIAVREVAPVQPSLEDVFFAAAGAPSRAPSA